MNFIHEILKFPENLNTEKFREIQKSPHKVMKLQYFTKQIVYCFPLKSNNHKIRVFRLY